MEPAVASFVALVKEVHGGIRKAVADLEPAALGWKPGQDTNSIAVLVVHTLGAEEDFFKLVRGLPRHRDRDAEFVDHPVTAEELLARLDGADTLLDEHAAAITAKDLATIRERPPRSPQPGTYWLFLCLGHAREHLAHVELTKQLYLQRRSDHSA